jgi:hypothetical protein
LKSIHAITNCCMCRCCRQPTSTQHISLLADMGRLPQYGNPLNWSHKKCAEAALLSFQLSSAATLPHPAAQAGPMCIWPRHAALCHDADSTRPIKSAATVPSQGPSHVVKDNMRAHGGGSKMCTRHPPFLQGQPPSRPAHASHDHHLLHFPPGTLFGNRRSC